MTRIREEEECVTDVAAVIADDVLVCVSVCFLSASLYVSKRGAY